MGEKSINPALFFQNNFSVMGPKQEVIFFGLIQTSGNSVMNDTVFLLYGTTEHVRENYPIV